MKLYGLLLAIVLMSCAAHTSRTPVLSVVNYDELKEVIEKQDDKLYVVNFWATWCRPCVEELPHFMEVNKMYEVREDYQMILVSLDKADLKDTEVTRVIKKLNIDTDVYILSDNQRMNMWIPAIDSTWSGAIPATVMYKNGAQVHFTEGQLSKEELDNTIKKHL
jgi:thiol-disulfide isomerase/thioredoxin